MLSDDDVRARISMTGKEGNYLKLRRGIFANKHQKVLRGETFRVFVFLCSMANAKKSPRDVAEVGRNTVARMLEIGIGTAGRILKTLEQHGYIERHGDGWKVRKLRPIPGSETDPLDPKEIHPEVAEVDPKEIHSGSKTDPGVDPKQIQIGSKTDLPLPVNDTQQKPPRSRIREEVSRREEGSLSAATPLSEPHVYWDNEKLDVIIDEKWLSEQVRDFAREAKVTFTRGDYGRVKGDLRLRLLEDTRLRACKVTQSGKRSSPTQFKRLETLTLELFRRRIRVKAGYVGEREGNTRTSRSIAEIDSVPDSVEGWATGSDDAG